MLNKQKKFMVPGSRKRSITIEIAFVLPQQQFLKQFQVPAGTSIYQAIKLSGVENFYPEKDRSALKTGIYGKITSPETILHQNDRIEIYRPLNIDPKEKRRLKSDRLTKG